MVLSRLPGLLRRLKTLRQEYVDACLNDVPGLISAQAYAQTVLQHLANALGDGSVSRERWCLAAVGGFGRGELSFASDLDLLFVHHQKLPATIEEIVRELTYGLWDAGFEVGHSTASFSHILRLVREDFSVLTNCLEAQFVAGDRALYDQWRESFLEGFGANGRRRFMRVLQGYCEGRLRRYGESSYILEPHVKEGGGGLRDMHTIRWIAMVFRGNPSPDALRECGWLTAEEKLWLDQAYDFLWRVRLQLHRMTQRRQDQLLFGEQEQMAGRLGFMESEHGSAVEAFMRHYYRQSARIRRITAFVLERARESQRRTPSPGPKRRILPGPFLLEGRHLQFLEPDLVGKDPRLLMTCFREAARHGAHFHHQAGSVIRENLGLWKPSMGEDPRVVRQFFEILLHPQQAFDVLKVMLETGFLQTFLPEFAPLRYRVQYDVYHLYTVDEHLLRTVRELHRMEREKDEDPRLPGLCDIFVPLENRRILYLAALLHDVGKGNGKGHAARGALMVRTTGARLGLLPEETDLLSFLVEHHLLLAETALKRDLMDEKPVTACAFKIGDREKLRMLYLLTIADSRATGPGAWNTWKASLLRELYAKVDHVLCRGNGKGEDLRRRSEESQARVLRLAQEDPRIEKIRAWLDRVSYRYLASQEPESMLIHYGMEQRVDRETVVLETRQAEGGLWQITLAVQDRPGLFALITGVLWLRGLNILSADIYTRPYGVALDVLMVEGLPDPLHAQELWERIRADLVEALHDRTGLDARLAAKKRPSILHQRTLPKKEDRVVIDEDASDFHTVIEVYTWDRPGVLHAVTQTLYENRVSIRLAKISTPGAQVADVFYVTDLGGSKLGSSQSGDRIREALLECLARV